MRSSLFALLFFAATAASAQFTEGPSPGGQPAGTTEIEVTGSMVGAAIRPVTIITRTQLDLLPAVDTATALRTVAGVDLRERAPFGAQADLGLYGSGFEGVLVLVDGFPVNDPQTGHHTLELLPPIEAVERIEILEGPASVTYGPGAQGGVVQIITRRPSDSQVLEADLAAGERDLARGAALASGAGVCGAASVLNTSGYAADTEVHEGTGFLRVARGRLDAEVLVQDKRFGAWQAYSDAFPNEWESVSGAEGMVRWTDGAWQAWAEFRHKRDHFVLDRVHPEWYDALHTTEGWQGQITRRFTWLGGALLAGVDGARETLDSTVLGNRARSRGGVFGEGYWTLGRVEVDAGLRAESSDGRRSLSPQVSVQWRLSGAWRAFAFAGRAERLPSFTELYTRSPAWTGNRDLAPERSWGESLGVKGTPGGVRVTASVFFRQGADLIDMVRPASTSEAFSARNVQRQDTRGVQVQADGEAGAAFAWHFSGMALSQSAAWPASLESRYADDGLRHKESLGVEYRQGKFAAGLRVGAWQRNLRAAHAEVDASLGWTLPVSPGHMRFNVEGRNLLNEPERGFFGAPGPGRWLWAGLAWGIG